MLLSPTRQNASRGPVSRGSSIPAPTEGWDDVSPLAGMDAKRAVILDNWFPQPGYVELRRGWAAHCVLPETAPVNSVMAYHGSTTKKLFAACNATIYDATSSSASASSVTTLASSKLQHVNFTTSGGHYLYAVNGADLPWAYNGSTWTNPAITGVDESTFVHVNVFKGRLWFVPVSSTKIWYLPIDSIAGAATSFELGGLMSLGGVVTAMGTITIDGGAGPDDHAVFVTSTGQALVYQGTDPSSDTTWSLVGVYNIAPPIGRRCMAKISGDLGILTTSGLLPLSKAMVVDRAAVTNVALTGNINKTMTASAREYSENFGWQVCVYPRSNMCIVNVPIQDSTTQHQYVMNTLQGAWARFTGQNAACWEVYADRLFFGGNNGKVYEADIAATDGGSAIIADLKGAFNYYGSPGVLKQWSMIQALILSDGRVAPGIKLNVDFGDSAPTYIPASQNLTAIYWNNFNWNEANWPSDRIVSQKWQAVNAVGQCAAVRMRVVADSTSTEPITLQVNGFNVIYQRGGFL